MTRPQTLCEVSRRTISAAQPFAHAIDEFLDTFYLDHPDKGVQAERLSEVPAFTGDAFIDAWIGAVGQHLADRWDLSVPPWTRRAGHFRLSRPRFIPDAPGLRSRLLLESPTAFRSRLIFTFVEPLQRARFPQAVARVRWPA
jgi:hypothetical protein